MQPRQGRSIAVIGSGIAGLTAAYLLSERNHVALFEADNRLGGHAHTHIVDDGRGAMVAIDSAFLVHNDRTNPTLSRLFADLGIHTHETDMSVSVRDDRSRLQYAGGLGLGGLFPSWANLGRPRYLRMLAEVKRFHRAAAALLETGDAQDTGTLGAFLDVHKFSRYFVDHFMTPLVAAVWSCAPGEAMNFPARYLFVFLQHHGMLSMLDTPAWHTIVGGSATYVDAIAARVQEIRLGTPAGSVRRTECGVEVTAGHGPAREFDAVVLAVHPHQALLALAEPTEAERAILGAIRYSANHAQLHTDTSLLPTHPRAQASRNYLATGGNGPVLVTYDISRLMGLAGPHRFLMTLGGRGRVDPDRVIAEMIYDQPLYTPESVAAQRLLPTLDDDRVVFAGAYHGWGFHEDGAAAGMCAAMHLGAQWPATKEAETVSC
ncbi:NAD(P)/FAD-dependent oxidoreductase [Mycobacterium sp. NPDC003323]